MRDRAASQQINEPAGKLLAGLGSVLRSVWGCVCFLALLSAAVLQGNVLAAMGRLPVGAAGAVWVHKWCRRFVRCLGIQFSVDGDELPGRLAASGAGFEAVICNHLSYLDILVLAAVRPFVMVAKTEVRSWPLLGWMTARAGTVYVTRGGKPETYPDVNAAMSQAYRSGLPVIFFPEGTTTDGEYPDGGVMPLRRGLFHSVLKDNVQVRVAALRYEMDGERQSATVANDVCWWGETSFVPHLFRFMGLRGVRGRVRFGGVVEGADRFALAENGRAAISSMYLEMAGVPAAELAPVAGLQTVAMGGGQEAGLVEALQDLLDRPVDGVRA